MLGDGKSCKQDKHTEPEELLDDLIFPEPRWAR